MTSRDCPNFDVSVGIEDVSPADWAERVYGPDIASHHIATNQKADMPDEPTAARESFGDIAPALAAYTDTVLFGDVWRRPDLSPRDRSLITVASLVSLYRVNELPFHLKRALENGVTRDELIETITHLAFYSGWPTANTALSIARGVFEVDNAKRS